VRPRWQRTTRRDVYTVDVTAFLSLMVILVPFLLITAVFSRTTIIELQQAVGEGTQQATPDPLQLQVTVRQAVIEVSYRGQAQPVQIDRSLDGSALQSLAALATDLKARYPETQEATLLLEPQIPYDLLVQVLDVLRVRLRQDEEDVEREALFPEIALGPAAVTAQSGRGPL
jgi:biopolymer transport protein ExbD